MAILLTTSASYHYKGTCHGFLSIAEAIYNYTSSGKMYNKLILTNSVFI